MPSQPKKGREGHCWQFCVPHCGPPRSESGTRGATAAQYKLQTTIWSSGIRIQAAESTPPQQAVHWVQVGKNPTLNQKEKVQGSNHIALAPSFKANLDFPSPLPLAHTLFSGSRGTSVEPLHLPHRQRVKPRRSPWLRASRPWPLLSQHAGIFSSRHMHHTTKGFEQAAVAKDPSK